jgi:hypothetical protein
MSQFVRLPQNGPMTQGTIFACAVASDYPGCIVHGLVITARCDLAHGKAPVVSYLPVVRLEDWLHRDGRLLLAQRASAEAMSSMRSTLKQAKLSEAVLETEEPRKLLDALFVDTSNKKLHEQFAKACTLFELAHRCAASRACDGVALDLAQLVPHLRIAIVKELIRHSLSGFYFLPSVEPRDSELGYVVLVREVQSLPKTLALNIAEGLDSNVYESACTADASLRGKLAVGEDDFACPVGQLASPQLEHLLQSFAFLFGRIGLPDPAKNYIDSLLTRLPTAPHV